MAARKGFYQFCNKCKCDIGTYGFNKHVNACTGLPPGSKRIKHPKIKVVMKVKTVIIATPCKYCAKSYESSIGLSNHERRCPKNLERVMEALSEDGRERIKISSTRNANSRWEQAGSRELQSTRMKKAVEDHPESYASGHSNKRVKKIYFDGLSFNGTWEVIFYKWCLYRNIKCIRTPEWFNYEYEGTRKYFPDFYLPDYDLYVEVKGQTTDKDLAKWNQFPKNIAIIKVAEITAMKKNLEVNLQNNIWQDT